jgi:hypothetical protein
MTTTMAHKENNQADTDMAIRFDDVPNFVRPASLPNATDVPSSAFESSGSPPINRCDMDTKSQTTIKSGTKNSGLEKARARSVLNERSSPYTTVSTTILIFVVTTNRAFIMEPKTSRTTSTLSDTDGIDIKTPDTIL